MHDTHGNISPAQIEPATVTLLWQTNPHVDCRERALRTAELIAQTVRGEIEPIQAIEKPPIALNILVQGTSMEPMRTFLAAARAFEEEARDPVRGDRRGLPLCRRATHGHGLPRDLGR